jgi:tRNA-splicing ligase RtcB (3'-phosphate/5'-hydroxy nucleic acid ligase)
MDWNAEIPENSSAGASLVIEICDLPLRDRRSRRGPEPRRRAASSVGRRFSREIPVPEWPLVRVLKTPEMKVPTLIWDGDGAVPFEEQALAQMRRVCSLPFVHHHAALMADGHLGKGATVGAVIPTKAAIVPAAVGVDIGCGMRAARTNLRATDLPESLAGVRNAIEQAVPHGGPGEVGSWRSDEPPAVRESWKAMQRGYAKIASKHPHATTKHSPVRQLGTLGTGNHFIEVCLDTEDAVWLLLHSGSRGAGNRIGTYFIEQAREEMNRRGVHLPDRDLAYFTESSERFDDYVFAVSWAQDYARVNRELMLDAVVRAMSAKLGRAIATTQSVVDCHHNYVARETHFGERVWVTRKGAVRAGEGELGIIPGSMGARSFIVRGKGNAQSLQSCSHGAGRLMSRGEARRRFTLADHERDTAGVECRKDRAVLDETPRAYKRIEDVMAAQSDLIEVVTALRQVVCVKG